uniref:hypothetical protein n=1 Tax=Paractinoplanes polyasparticus TaxID=2856853 RepID=UPI001C852D61|nr:hypothetical protein [Actinoplanes polyasparticus]
MTNIHRLTSAVAAVLIATLGLAVASTPASAVTGSDVGNCLYSIGIYETHLGIPRKVVFSGPVGPGQQLPATAVVVNGNIDVAGNYSCSAATVQFRLQTKVCGTFGCDWKTKSETNTVRLPADGRVPTELRMDCRQGTHSYRLQAAVTHVELTPEDNAGRWYPQLTTVTNNHEGLDDKIAC